MDHKSEREVLKMMDYKFHPVYIKLALSNTERMLNAAILVHLAHALLVSQKP